MTQGTRIKWIRKLRQLTQKELGLLCGFSENTADVRIRQYESNSKTPQTHMLYLLASALKVNTLAIQNYNMACSEDIIESLFWLEESSGLNLLSLSPDNITRGEVFFCTFPHSSIGFTLKHDSLNQFLEEWYIRHNELDKQEISYEQYQNWKLNFPLSCDKYIGTTNYVDWKRL